MELGRISAIFRYPVKSMAGELLDVARLSWHGIEGDRRLAFRRLTDKSGFPWLTASKLPQLLLYKPFGRNSNTAGSNTAELLPTHVRTPDALTKCATCFSLSSRLARLNVRRYG
jgi:uncharacterized protein YcbX